MLDTLKFLGNEPHLLGVATLGGILSLIFLIATLSRRLWRSRKSLAEPFRKRRLRKGRELLDNYFWAKRWKKIGLSDLFIGGYFLQRTLHYFGSVIFCIIISAVNYIAYIDGSRVGVLNYLMYWAFLILAINDLFKMRRSFYSAFDLMTFANRPIGGLELLKRRLRRIKKGWW